MNEVLVWKMVNVTVENLVKIYGEGDSLVNALNGINFETKNDEFIVCMGPSGAGKSTLIYMLAGLDSPTRGTIYIDEEEVTSMTDSTKCDLRRYKIGIIFQFFNLHPGLTVCENVQLPLVIAGIPKKEHQVKIERVLNLVDLDKRRNHYPYELSGGEQQRTTIARALVMEPSLLLADEPTGDLDSENGHKIIDLLHELAEKQRVTVIEVTHDESMLRLGDRLIQMADGKIINDFVLESEEQIPKYESLNKG